MDLSARAALLAPGAPAAVDRFASHMGGADRFSPCSAPTAALEVPSCMLRHTTRSLVQRRVDSRSLRAQNPKSGAGAALDHALSHFTQDPLSLPRNAQRTRHRGRQSVVAEGGGAGLADEQGQDRGTDGLASIQVPSGKMMVPTMKKGFGAYGGGATLEKSKLDLSSASTKVSPQLEQGGGGGKNGKGVSFGGGDGGDDGGDDDDYFGEGDEGDDDGDDGFLRRGIVTELFDRASVEAVLQEWFRTMQDLPAGLFRAVELGLVSSAQLARFMSIDARPTIARVLSRLAPTEISRSFIGRMMADPAFIFKVALEQTATIAAAAHWEVKQRGDRLRQEWDQALVNVLTVAACNAAVVWCLSPTRSYGTTARSDWQNVLQKLPNHVFDKSYPLREFNMQSRAGAFFYKAAELSLVGTVVGAVSGCLSSGLLSLKKRGNPDFKPSLPVPSASMSAAAYGAHMGISGNLRYQLLYGLDRVLQQNFNHIPMAILGTTALRCGNVLLGEPSRLAWLGLDEESLLQQKAESSAYRRPSSGAAKKGSVLEQAKAWLEDVKKGRRVKARRARGVAQGAGQGQGEGAGADAAVKRPKRKVKQRMAVA